MNFKIVSRIRAWKGRTKARYLAAPALGLALGLTLTQLLPGGTAGADHAPVHIDGLVRAQFPDSLSLQLDARLTGSSAAWRQLTDPNSGQTLYVNPATGQTVSQQYYQTFELPTLSEIDGALDAEGFDFALSDLSDAVVARVEIQPGAAVPWHTHYGPTFVFVQQGQMTITFDNDCEPRQYGAGSVFVHGGESHNDIAENRGDSVLVTYVVAFGVPEGAPVSVLLDAPAC